MLFYSHEPNNKSVFIMTNKIKIFVGAEGIEPSHRNHFFITLRYPSRSHAPFFKPPYSHEPDRWFLIKNIRSSRRCKDFYINNLKT